jgi:hypothetical protein
VSYDPTNNLIRISGDNVQFGTALQLGDAMDTGWDCTGLGIYVTGANAQIANSKIIRNSSGVGGFIQFQGSGGGTIVYNKLDSQNYSGSIGCHILIQAPGSYIIQYNDDRNEPSDPIDVAQGVGQTVTLNCQFNSFANNGSGLATGAHPDWIQMFGQGPTIPTIQFNSVINNTSTLGGNPYGTQGFTTGDNYFTPTFPSGSIQYNAIFASATPTLVGSVQGGIPNMFNTAYDEVTGPYNINNNYIDYNFVWDVVILPPTGSVTFNNNINMRTGAVIVPPG